MASPEPEVFADLVAESLETARAEEATGQQIAILESAQVAGVMSYALAHDALANYFECLSDNGIGVDEEVPAPGRAFPPINYSVFASDTTMMDLCYAAEFAHVDRLYQLQPAIAAEIERVVTQARATIVACLEANGYSVAADATYDELRDAAYFAAYGVHVGTSLADAPEAWEGIDCYEAAGIESNALHDGPG